MYIYRILTPDNERGVAQVILGYVVKYSTLPHYTDMTASNLF